MSHERDRYRRGNDRKVDPEAYPQAAPSFFTAKKVDRPDHRDCVDEDRTCEGDCANNQWIQGRDWVSLGHLLLFAHRPTARHACVETLSTRSTVTIAMLTIGGSSR
jgi:hypothetical protein